MEAHQFNRVEEAQESSPKEKPVFRDVPFAAVFLLHLVGVFVVLGLFAPGLVADVQAAGGKTLSSSSEADNLQTAAEQAFILALPFLIFAIIFSILWAAAWIFVVKRFAETLIWVALVTTPVALLILTIALALLGITSFVLATAAFTVITALYAGWIIFYQRFRIQFATLILRNVTAVITLYGAQRVWVGGVLTATFVHCRFPGTILTTFIGTFPAMAWQFIWLFASLSALYHFYTTGERFTYTDPTTGQSGELVAISADGVFALLFLIFSNYWCGGCGRRAAATWRRQQC